eukprot:COSAG01_NODE_53277_length_340_cov_1.041494_1_plen_34_part_01
MADYSVAKRIALLAPNCCLNPCFFIMYHALVMQL